MAEKFNIRPVYVDFLNTLDEKLSSSDVGSEIHVSRKESCDGPISEVNFRFGWKSFSLLSNGSCGVPVLLIPYIGLPSVIFGRKLKRLLKDYYCIDVKVVFSSFKVKNYFSLKCHTPMP